MVSTSSLKGIEQGKLVLSSGLLQSSWSKISESTYLNQDSSLGIKIHEEGNITFVVFAAPPLTTNDSALTLLSRSQDQNPNPFPFLCSEKISEFSVHSRALRIFFAASRDLFDLKSKLQDLLKSGKPVIITGAWLGGSVASLFTLWLLETIDPKYKRPLCITFGSPLIGDAALQQILENSVRNSCFLHVADAAQTPIQAGFKPFGTFLICFVSECICIEDPEAVLELLTGVDADQVDYGQALQRLEHSVLSMAADSRLISDDIIKGMEEREEKKKLRVDPFKKLNGMKILMIYVEWYKKTSKKAKIGYYDRFKTQTMSPSSEFDVAFYGSKKELNEYWKSVVEEVEKMPQSDVSILKRRFLFSGNNYRRLMEPLDIAEYYLKGGKEYRTTRSRHYVMLEKWFGNESINPKRSEKSGLSDLLTFDSCFWAEVEEAMIVINSLKSHEGMSDDISMQKLLEFEKYVWGMIVKREVSPEIFLEKTSFMSWWKEYKEIQEKNEVSSSPSDFAEFMNSGQYQTYGQSAEE